MTAPRSGRVLVTGATGFVGRHLTADLLSRGYHVRAAVRSAADASLPDGAAPVTTGDLAQEVDWGPALAGVDLVVHAAGLAHADGRHAETGYDRVNTQATLALARAARAAGVRRFVFLSSIRAQSGFAAPAPLTEADAPHPTDAYGRSKLAAERGLASLDLDWIALRPVLVHGPGMKANMAALARLAALPLPLPLAGLTARRSILALDNLASAIAFALTEACPARRAYIVADPEPVTVPGMITAMRAGRGRGPGLFAVPAAVLGLAARLLGQGGRLEKLSAGLVASPAALIAAGWEPAVTSEQALAEVAAGRGGA